MKQVLGSAQAYLESKIIFHDWRPIGRGHAYASAHFFHSRCPIMRDYECSGPASEGQFSRINHVSKMRMCAKSITQDNSPHPGELSLQVIFKSSGILVIDKPWGVRMDGDFEVSRHIKLFKCRLVL